MLKKVLAVTGIAAVLMFNGCLLDSEEGNSISFKTITVTDTVRVGSGAIPVTGVLEANSDITNVQFKVLKGGSDVTTSFDVYFVSASGKSKIDLEDQGTTIRATGTSLTSGTYQLEISGDVNGEISSTKISFQVKNGSGTTDPEPDLTESTITVAGHGHASMGSSFDLDNGDVLLSSAATAANSGVDLVYTYSNSLGSPVLLTPVYAKNESGIGAFSGWVSPNNTQFHLVNADFDAITTKAEVEALFDASQVSSSGREPCAAGDVFVVKTDTGAYALLQMETVSSDDSGTANIKYAL